MSLNSYQLKYIALVSMIIDHVGIVFAPFVSPTVYYILRGIGRLAFPIFSFLLVEGFFHTRNRTKYLLRILIFAVISEIPFDLVLHTRYTTFPYDMMDWSHQNVFFTLALGFFTMMFMEHYQAGRNLALFVAVFFFPFVGEMLHFDYGSIGILTIIVFYLQKKKNAFPLWFCIIPLMLQSKIQAVCVASLIPIYLYKGEKGHGWKYLFYIAYPAHILLIFAIRLALFA